MPNESESLPPRKYTEDYSIIKLLPSIMNRILAPCNTEPCLPRPEFFLLFLFVFLLLLSPALLGVSSDTEMTNPPPSVWDVHRHNRST